MQISSRACLFEGTRIGLVLLSAGTDGFLLFGFGNLAVVGLSRDGAHASLVEFLNHLALLMLQHRALLQIILVYHLLIVHALEEALSDMLTVLRVHLDFAG